MENLSNFATDFERKRQFAEAEGGLLRMAGHDPKYRAIESNLSRAKQLSETVMLSGGGGGKINASILGDGESVEKSMLGRYQIEKELCKGAMGVVYPGKDPKIGRVSMGQMMFGIMSESPTDILSINPMVPAGIVAFPDRAMNKEPVHRFQTGEEFAAAGEAATGATQPASESATSGVDFQL